MFHYKHDVSQRRYAENFLLYIMQILHEPLTIISHAFRTKCPIFSSAPLLLSTLYLLPKHSHSLPNICLHWRALLCSPSPSSTLPHPFRGPSNLTCLSTVIFSYPPTSYRALPIFLSYSSFPTLLTASKPSSTEKKPSFLGDLSTSGNCFNWKFLPVIRFLWILSELKYGQSSTNFQLKKQEHWFFSKVEKC